MKRLAPRLLLSFLGVVASLVGAELWLRASYADLPSLEALRKNRAAHPQLDRFLKTTQRDGQLERCDEPPPGHRPVEVELHGSEGEELVLHVAGDSIAQGWGVGPREGWASVLAGKVAEHAGRRVSLRRTGAPGQGFCSWSAETHGALDTLSPPDLAVLQVFVDDIEVRGMILLDGEVAAVPGFGLSPPLRALTWRSWLANRLWFAWATRLGAEQPERLDSLQGQRLFVESMQQLGERLDLAHAAWTLALVGPAGQHLCETDPRPRADCEWLGEDGERLARWLDDSGLPWIDLREAFAETPSDLLDRELGDLQHRHRLPVHPGPEGHRVLAEALWPWAEEALAGDLVEL